MLTDNNRGNGRYRLVLGFLIGSFGFIQARQIENCDQLKWGLRAGSVDRPNMSALLIYDSSKMLAQDLNKILGLFNKAAHNQAYRDFVEFLKFDLKTNAGLACNNLNQDLNIARLPLIALFNNFELTDTLSGFRLDKFRNIVNFVTNSFKVQINAIKAVQQDKDRETIRLIDYPPYFYGASFGEPFYSSYYGRHFYGGYLYPYNYSIYFNTAFFTQMNV